MAAPVSITPARRAKLARCVATLDADMAPFTSGDSAAAGSAAGWTSEGSPAPGVVSHSIAVAGASLRKYRAVGVVKAPAARVARLLWSPDLRLQWDLSYAGIDNLAASVVEPAAAGDGVLAGDEVVLQRMRVKAVLVVSQRDFVCMHLRRELADGTIFAIGHSVPEEDGVFEPTPDYVRGAVLEGSGWHCKPVLGPNGEQWCEMTYVILIDLKGWVPAFVVNGALAWTFEAYFRQVREAVTLPAFQ